MSDIDTTNYCLVASTAGTIVIMAPPRSLTAERALNLAAWLVAVACINGATREQFDALLDAVENT